MLKDPLELACCPNLSDKADSSLHCIKYTSTEAGFLSSYTPNFDYEHGYKIIQFRNLGAERFTNM